MLGNRLIPFSAVSVTSVTSGSEVSSNVVATASQVAGAIAPVQNNTATSQISVSPNPVVNSAVIDIRIKEPGKIKLDLLDQQGRLVKRITDGLTDEKSLNQRFLLNASAIGSGMYVVRLVTRSGVITPKNSSNKVD